MKMCNIIRYKPAIILCKRDYYSLSWSSHALYGAAVLKYFADKTSIEKAYAVDHEAYLYVSVNARLFM